MRILYFHQHFSTPNGAAGTRSYEFAKQLIKNGHSVTIVCGKYWIADSGLNGEFIDNKRTGTFQGINIIQFNLNYSNSMSFLYRTLIFIKFVFRSISVVINHEYDIILASSTPLTIGIPGIIAKVFKKKPFVFEVRDLWPELPKAMGVIKNPIILNSMGLLEKLTYYFSNACIGLSPGIVEGIKNKAPGKPVIMIPNGSDNDLIKKLNLNDIEKEQKFIAVFTGAHGIANGLNSILDAAEILKEEKQNDIEIQFIGDGALKPKLMKIADKRNLYNCNFINPMPKIELFQYLTKKAHLGLMVLENIPAFYYGTSPNKFFDYIALGLPVLNNYPGWLSDLIKKNKCGISIEPDNAKLFAESLIYIKNNVKKREIMSKNSKNLAINSFDRNLLSQNFVSYLEKFESN